MEKQLPKVVYVAGPFRGDSHWDIEQNIRRAEELSLEIWKAGGAGLSIGRNVFQHANPALMVKAMSAIVHKGASVEQALKILGESQ